MKEIIGKILEGNFDYDNGSLDFSCSKLEISLRPGETAEGVFRIFGTEGKPLEGEVFSSDMRMECLTRQFTGSGEEIGYRFCSEELEEGDVVKGEFYVISSQGEYYLPYVVTVEHTQIESSLGSIKNLFHFANLAKVNPGEAVSLFYSPEFSKVFTGNDRQYYNLYQGLKVYPGNAQNVEEFLLGINKKQKIEYLIQEEEIRLEAAEGVTGTILNITKNGWGYVQLFIETEGDFLYTEKTMLTDDDFLGNYCRLPVYMDNGLLHEGNNYGSVRLYNASEAMTVPVTVKCRMGTRSARTVLERQRQVVQLMEYYQAFRMKKVSTATWLKETGKLVERLTAINENDVSARLFQAQLLITGERYNEAQWILDHAADILEQREEESPVLWAYYLYLTTLVSREEEYVDKITAQVEKIYRKNRSEWRVAWLLLYLSEEYGRSASKKLMFLEEQFNRGCRSPIIYIEALLLIHMNPALLMKLGGFEKQILNYAAKKDFLSADMIYQSVYLIQKQREYSPGIFKYLEACYRTKQDDSVLREICTQLIRGNRVGPEYFPWYKKGVERELRITRLYEYYMMSVDLNYTGALPRMVMMYFSYQSSLDYERNAFLYANIHRYREKNTELYESYRETIEQFVVEQIQKNRINGDLAYLYKEVLVPRIITEPVAEALARLLFVNLIQTERKDIRQVIVYQPWADTEYQYPMSDGIAWVPLFGNDYTVLFEDGNRNRYAAGVAHTTRKLMIPGKLAKMIAPMVCGQLGYDVYMCMAGKEPAEITEENEARFLRLQQSPAIVAEYKREICIRLIQYYYDHDKIKELDEYLERMDISLLTAKERSEALKYLVLRGKEQKAYEYVCRYGPYHAEPKTLMRLCSHILAENGFSEDRQLTMILIYAFRRGKYDENVLRYLSCYYRGMTKELRDIWKAAEAFDVDTYAMSERMIVQMLFSGAYIGEKMQVFKSYVSGGAKPEVEAAFLAQCAYDYFVKDKLTDGYVFEEIYRMYSRGEALPEVSKIALLKYCAENKKTAEPEMTQALLEFLRELLQRRVYLKFMLEYADLEPALNRLLDKTIVEYKAHPDARAVMHYVIEREDTGESEYLTEEMQQVFGGVCFKTFVLFFGESLQYYIVEERNGSEQLTESGTIQKSDIGSNVQDSKFTLINDIVIGNTLKDYDTVDRLMEEYYYKEFMRERLFRLS